MKVLFVESHNLDRPEPLGSHHYIRLFSGAGHRCLWLGPAISPFHLGKADHLNRHRFEVWSRGGSRVDGIDWLVPFTALFYYRMPGLGSSFAGRNQYRFTLPPLKRLLGRKGFGEVDLLWCAGPTALSVLDLIPHRVSVYRLADRIERFPRVPASAVVLQEELVRRVDLVFATAKSLERRAVEVAGREKVKLIPNGVSDYFLTEEGEASFAPGESCPGDYPVTGDPVAVYIGTMDRRFDFEVLRRAVEKLPRVHFLLIGPVTDRAIAPALAELARRDNLTMLGAKPQQMLAAYLRRASVGLIPFKLDSLTESVNPIKFYEYLACGLPVVASPLPELRAMGGPWRPYDPGTGMAEEAIEEAIVSAISERSDRSALAGRLSFARENSWQARFDLVTGLVEAVLEKRS